ncbi:unnamed protein product [Rotaria sp. Silwood2]|nr:unnamed protein product [Rotaria sp. Silwood2]CAF4223262.1 unnamed protein product [Rotaria sp. Silwood2]
MIYPLYNSYLLWLINLLSKIYHIRGSNELATTFTNNDSIFTVWIIMIFCILLSSLLGILFQIIINYYQLQKFISIVELSNQQLSNKYTSVTNVKKYKTINDLPNFIPLIPYRSFYIDRTTSNTIVDDLIIRAKETRRFTVICFDDCLSPNKIQIEFIRESESIIVLIETFRESRLLSKKIKQLFSTIFVSTNIIQAWGDIVYDLSYLRNSGFITFEKFRKIRLLNIQQDFKQWYNQTFNHNQNCSQMVDYNDIDGPLCSCSHRPYKCFHDEWSLSYAIAYTFAEYLHLGNEHDVNQCLAITKLSRIVQEQWTRQQIKDFIKENHIAHRVRLIFIKCL